MSGKQATFEKINVQNIFETFNRKESVLMIDRSSLPFVRQIIAHIKKEFKRNLCF